ncbi:MAG: 16S rRNA (uracil(1498)-N(3))-methyltransferase [Proteobacteria bacterium]|nr:16S rRNA (uracil(1498)-N(3))-methyltransferase [Pseudomonadota bacterium]
MRIPRIHVEPPLAPGVEIVLPQQAAAHVARVLRLRTGDPLILFDGDGHDYASELAGVSPRSVHVRVLSAHRAAGESPLRITLAQALARGEKMDWIIQKATELGAAAIVPLVTERSEVKLEGARADKRASHWRGVAIGACEQSGRARVPGILAPQGLAAWLESLDRRSASTRLALFPGGESSPRALTAVESEILLAVGPEGGFGDGDIAALRAAGFSGLALGPRVLRTETAGIAAMAALQALYGDL